MGGVTPRRTTFFAYGAACLLAGASACERQGQHGETGGTTGGDSGVPEVCELFVACMQEFDATEGEKAAAEYGEGGACWTRDEIGQAACLRVCDVQLRTYAAAFPDLMACDASKIVTDVEFEIGEAVFDPVDPLLDPVYRPLGVDDHLTIVRGGQGLLMLPLGLRGSHFEITADPNDWDNPRIPMVDLVVDIDGFNVGPGDHFARLNNYSVGFVETATAGVYEHMYIAVLVPDAVADPTMLTGKAGRVEVTLYTFNKPSVTHVIDFTVAPKIQEY